MIRKCCCAYHPATFSARGDEELGKTLMKSFLYTLLNWMQLAAPCLYEQQGFLTAARSKVLDL